MSGTIKIPAGIINTLVKALEFYADPRRYMGPNQRNDFSDPYSPGPYLQDVSRDGGEIARVTLACIEALNGGEKVQREKSEPACGTMDST